MSDSMEIQDDWNWQDWLDMVLGLWLVVSPWILDFADNDPAATRNAVVVGIVIAVLSALTFLAYHVVEEWIDVILGFWLIVSPWVLSSARDTPLPCRWRGRGRARARSPQGASPGGARFPRLPEVAASAPSAAWP